MNKRAETSIIPMIIAIVIGIAVLVLLVFGFTTGWGNFFDRVVNFGGGKANIETIRSACELACTTNSISDYCNLERTVKFGKEVSASSEKVKSIQATCDEMSGGTAKGVNLISEGLNVVDCPTITCPAS